MVDCVTIREASVRDAAQIGELLAELGYPVDAQEASERLARNNEVVFVAEDNGRVVGFLSIWSQLPIARSRPVARVTAMVVRSTSRGRGFGKALMNRAVEWARAEGCEGIELTSGIRDERADAHKFYERHGFLKTSYRFWLPIT